MHLKQIGEPFTPAIEFNLTLILEAFEKLSIIERELEMIFLVAFARSFALTI